MLVQRYILSPESRVRVNADEQCYKASQMSDRQPIYLVRLFSELIYFTYWC